MRRIICIRVSIWGSNSFFLVQSYLYPDYGSFHFWCFKFLKFVLQILINMILNKIWYNSGSGKSDYWVGEYSRGPLVINPMGMYMYGSSILYPLLLLFFFSGKGFQNQITPDVLWSFVFYDIRNAELEVQNQLQDK